MSSRVIQSKHIYDAGFHEFYTYGTGALNSNIGILNSVQTMTIKNGNVGIGTATPTQKLHIEGNIFAKGNVTCSNISVIGDFVTLNTITSNTEQVVVENAGTGPALKVTQTGNNSVAEFYDKESGLALFVGNGGNIGIGTNNPIGKLDVNGTIKSKNPCFDVTNPSSGASGAFIIYQRANLNQGNGYNTATGIFTVPISGIYVFIYGSLANTTNTAYRLWIYVNGSQIGESQLRMDLSETGSAYATNTSMTYIKSLNAGDRIQMEHVSDTGTALDIAYPDQNYNYWRGWLLS